MLTFLPRVEQWRDLVDEERGDLPADLVLSMIQQESRGKVGLQAGKPTPVSMDLPSYEHGTVHVSHAYGLMQVVPSVVIDFNRHPDNPTIHFEEISGTDEHSARLQIRVGVWYYHHVLGRLNWYDSAIFPYPARLLTENALKMALAGYRMGFGGLTKKLDALQARGLPLTWKALSQTFPNWGLPANRVIHYVTTIWARFMGSEPTTESKTNLAIPILIALILAAIIAALTR